MIFILFFIILILIIYNFNKFKYKYTYIDFINEYCKDENLENALYLYLNGNKNNELINAYTY